MPSPGPDDDDEEGTILTQNYARSKRRIAALEDELTELKNDGMKKKSYVCSSSEVFDKHTPTLHAKRDADLLSPRQVHFKTYHSLRHSR
jgi:hypothetical protein